MSEENKISEPSTNEAQNQVNQQPVFQIPTEAAELVGDGKKYQSVEDALKSVPHAQKHIVDFWIFMGSLGRTLCL